MIPGLILFASAFAPPKWIEAMPTGNPASLSPGCKKLLEGGHVKIRPLVCEYQGSSLSRLDPFRVGQAQARASKWTCQIDAKAVNGDTFDLSFHFKVISGSLQSAGVAVAFDIADWSTANYVFVPGCVYSGNRFRSLKIAYPPYFYAKEDQRPDLPVTITDVQRLGQPKEPSLIELNTGNASTPAMGFQDMKNQSGLLLLTEQGTRFGNSGLFIEESSDRKRATFVISAPGVRDRRLEMMGSAPSGDQASDWITGDEVSLHVRLCAFKAVRPGDLLDRFFKVRKDLSGPTQYRQLTPFSEAWTLREKAQNEMRWFGAYGYYKTGNGDSPYGHLQMGWVGGLMVTEPLLLLGDQQSRTRALTNIDLALTRIQGRSGLMYGIYRRGDFFGDTFADSEKTASVAMIRKNADVLYFLFKQLLLLRQQGAAPRPDWDTSARRLVNAFRDLWDRYGQLGQFVDVDTGDIVVGGSTAGAIAPAGLALASQYFNDPRYLETASAIARQYVARDLNKGYTDGGPGEILQCPDSESAFALLESLTVLYESTGDKEWLTDAESAADLCSSWVVSYDYKFPPASSLGKIGAHSTGTVWASVQNKHAAPGICTASGDCLLKLYRATGNPIYLDLLKDIAHNILEFLSVPGRAVGDGALPGSINERVNLSDWEGKENVGAVGSSSTSWPEVSVMLTCAEVPGIYVRLDKGEAWGFDHVDVKVLGKSAGGVTLQVTNPTLFAAHVTVLAEGAEDIRKPLGVNALAHAPAIDLKPGESKNVVVSPGGRIGAKVGG